jgi:hypothetical protein
MKKSDGLSNIFGALQSKITYSNNASQYLLVMFKGNQDDL